MVMEKNMRCEENTYFNAVAFARKSFVFPRETLRSQTQINKQIFICYCIFHTNNNIIVFKIFVLKLHCNCKKPLGVQVG